MMTEKIALKGLTKRFGPLLAVDDISMSIASGEVLGFLGPNGAGKSTTMRMLAGFIEPTSGTAEICGFDVTRHPVEVKRRIGYLPEGAPAYGDMTAESYLGFIAEVRGFDGLEKRRRIDEEGCYLIFCRHGVHRLKECQDCYVRSPEDQDFWERAMALVEAPSISSWYASRPSSTTVQGKR